MSKVWIYFDKESNGGICKLCKSFVKTGGNTTNLKQHAERAHNIHFEGDEDKEPSAKRQVS